MFVSSSNTEIIELLKSKGYQLNDNSNIYSVDSFSNIDDELFSLYNGVGLRLNKSAKILELLGKDCLDFIHRITTNSILNLPANEFIKTIFTNEKGRIIGLADILNLGENLLLKTDFFFKDKIIAWINRYVITDDVTVKEPSNNNLVIDFFGPQRFSFIEWLFDSQSISVSSNKIEKIRLEDFELLLLSSSREHSENGSFSLILNDKDLLSLLSFILNKTGPFDFNLIGKTAFESYRIEQGILNAESELNDNFNPHELNLSELIDTKKGCYIGQEVLARLETYDKVQKKITGLEFSEDIISDVSTEILDENNEIAGYITSKVYSHKLKKYIGLGVIRKKYLSGENHLYVITKQNNKVRTAIHNLPFIKTVR